MATPRTVVYTFSWLDQRYNYNCFYGSILNQSLSVSSAENTNIVLYVCFDYEVSLVVLEKVANCTKTSSNAFGYIHGV